MFERFCHQHGCEILVLHQEHWSPEQELVQDLLTIMQVFSARLYELRNYRKSLKEAIHADVSPQDPTPDQIRFFKQAAGTARLVWNWALAEWD